MIAVGLFGETEFWFALIKVVAILILIAIGIVLVMMHYPTPHGHASINNLFQNGGFFPKGFKGFFMSFQMVTFGFIGIETIGVMASETQDPKRVIPKAINEIPARIILFYVGSLTALMCIYPWNQISMSQSPFVQVFQDIGILAAAGIINFVVFTAAASAVNSSLFTTGRMMFTLNYRRKGKFAKQMSTLSKTSVPANGLIFSAVIIAVTVLMEVVVPSASTVFTFISSVATTCFLFIWGAIMVAHLRYRRELKQKQETVGKFRLPLYPLANYLVIAFLIMVGIVMCLEKTTLVALVAAMIWFVVSFILVKVKKV